MAHAIKGHLVPYVPYWRYGQWLSARSFCHSHMDNEFDVRQSNEPGFCVTARHMPLAIASKGGPHNGIVHLTTASWRVDCAVEQPETGASRKVSHVKLFSTGR